MAQLKADAQGRVRGVFRIPAGVPAGSKSVGFTGGGGSRGEAVFVGQGSLTTQTLRQVTNVTTWYYDPLAQTFSLTRNVQLAGADLWFTARKTQVRVQIREVSNGVPSRTILAERVLEPEDIVVGGGGHTRILFDAPLSLTAGTEYALVVLFDDPLTKLSIAEMGKYDKTRAQWVTAQPYAVGVLLSSSNASTWTPHQDRDLAFRLLEARYRDAAPHTLDMGGVSLSGATDVLLMGLSDIPTAQCRLEYDITLPDGSRQTVAEGQALTLAAPQSGTVAVRATLHGDASASPVLWPGCQLLAGRVGTSGTYCTRAVTARNATSASLIYDAVIPSGASVTPEIQIDGGDWAALDNAGSTRGDDGAVEFRWRKSLSGAQLVRVRLTLRGTSQARPIVRNVRLLAVQ